MDRPGDAKFDNKNQISGVQFDLRHDDVFSLVKGTARWKMRVERHGLDNGQQRGSHLSTKENKRPIEDTPMGGLHKIRQISSQGVDVTLKELKLTNQEHSSDQPAG